MPIRTTFVGLSLSIAALLAAGPASAQMISAKSPEAVFSIAKSQGYAPDMLNKKDSAPSFRMTVNDSKSLVLFMNCDDRHRNCKTIQFYIGFSVSDHFDTSRINGWNRDKRFARAYVDNSGDPVMEMDLDLDFNGIPRENVAEAFNLWSTLVESFSDFINNDGGSDAPTDAEAAVELKD